MDEDPVEKQQLLSQEMHTPKVIEMNTGDSIKGISPSNFKIGYREQNDLHLSKEELSGASGGGGPGGEHYLAMISSFSFGSNENAANVAKAAECEADGSPSKEEVVRTSDVKVDADAADVHNDGSELPNFGQAGASKPENGMRQIKTVFNNKERKSNEGLRSSDELKPAEYSPKEIKAQKL